jgi:hypothetical protein
MIGVTALTEFSLLSKWFIYRNRPGPRLLEHFRNKLIFYGEELLAPRPNQQAGGPPLFGCPQLLIQYIHSFPPYLEDVSCILNLMTPHAVGTRDPPNIEGSCEHGNETSASIKSWEVPV